MRGRNHAKKNQKLRREHATTKDITAEGNGQPRQRAEGTGSPQRDRNSRRRKVGRMGTQDGGSTARRGIDPVRAQLAESEWPKECFEVTGWKRGLKNTLSAT